MQVQAGSHILPCWPVTLGVVAIRGARVLLRYISIKSFPGVWACFAQAPADSSHHSGQAQANCVMQSWHAICEVLLPGVWSMRAGCDCVLIRFVRHLQLIFSHADDPDSVRHARKTERKHMARWICQKHLSPSDTSSAATAMVMRCS